MRPSQDLQFDIATFFEPFVRQWLLVTDNKTGQWVEAVSFYLRLLVVDVSSCYVG